jgi:uncharacterized membrane protein YjfL (UPF0719 family)
MRNQTNIEATVFAGVVGIVIVVLAFTILHFRNPQIEAQCIAKGGQVLTTPGRISSCLYPSR